MATFTSVARFTTLILCLTPSPIFAADWSLKDNPDLARYFESEVAKIETRESLRRFGSAEEWEEYRNKARAQLLDMLGISVNTTRPKLLVKKTGELRTDEFRVEKL